MALFITNNFVTKPSKMNSSEMTELTEFFTKGVSSSLIDQTKPCYTGSLVDIDKGTMRPVNYIGPLEREFLPDTPERKIIWLASLALSKEEHTQFITRIPGFKIVKKVDSPEMVFFSDIMGAAKKNCFDEAFRKDEYYLSAAQTSVEYGKMRSMAFEVTRPIELLRRMGYTQVKKPAVGDLIVYFANAIPPKEKGKGFTFSEKIRPSHYGRVVSIKNGTIVIQSKFNDSHVFEHRMDCIPYFYGNSYLFFSQKAKVTKL